MPSEARPGAAPSDKTSAHAHGHGEPKNARFEAEGFGEIMRASLTCTSNPSSPTKDCSVPFCVDKASVPGTLSV